MIFSDPQWVPVWWIWKFCFFNAVGFSVPQALLQAQWLSWGLAVAQLWKPKPLLPPSLLQAAQWGPVSRLWPLPSPYKTPMCRDIHIYSMHPTLSSVCLFIPTGSLSDVQSVSDQVSTGLCLLFCARAQRCIHTRHHSHYSFPFLQPFPRLSFFFKKNNKTKLNMLSYFHQIAELLFFFRGLAQFSLIFSNADTSTFVPLEGSRGSDCKWHLADRRATASVYEGLHPFWWNIHLFLVDSSEFLEIWETHFTAT